MLSWVPRRISDLIEPEVVRLWRLRTGHNQAEAARHLQVPISRLRKVERSKVAAQLGTNPFTPYQPTELLTQGERYRIGRQRCGLTVAAAANLVGVSDWWLTNMERNPALQSKLQPLWAAAEQKLQEVYRNYQKE